MAADWSTPVTRSPRSSEVLCNGTTRPTTEIENVLAWSYELGEATKDPAFSSGELGPLRIPLIRNRVV